MERNRPTLKRRARNQRPTLNSNEGHTSQRPRRTPAPSAPLSALGAPQRPQRTQLALLVTLPSVAGHYSSFAGDYVLATVLLFHVICDFDHWPWHCHAMTLAMTLSPQELSFDNPLWLSY